MPEAGEPIRDCVRKADLRARLGARRRNRDPAERELARAAITAAVLDWWHNDSGGRCRVVACYEPLPTEPGSVDLLHALTALQLRVLVPITLPDRDLSWRRWLAGGVGDDLGPAAISSAGLLLVPALAVDSAGNRLGRGGGSYDRALPRAARDATVAALVFADEFPIPVPVQRWDRPVDAVVTPDGFQLLAAHRDSSGTP